MNFDALISELGGFNRYQIFQFLLLNVIYMVPAMQNFSSIFTAAAPDLLCSSVGLRNMSFNCQSDPLIRMNNTLKSNDSEHNCQEWSFDDQVFHSTMVTKYDLVCSYAYLKSMSVSIYMSGLLIGSFVSGMLADRYGRLPIILLCGLITFSFGIATPFFPSLLLYSFGRFLVGFGAAGLLSVTFTMSTENVATVNRTFIGMLINFGWTSGILMLCLLSYFIRSHVYLEIAIAVPAALVVVAFFTLQESPRWLVVTGKYERAEKAYKAIAKCNKIKQSNLRLINNLLSEYKKEKTEKGDHESQTSQAGFVDIIKCPGLRRVLFIIWFQFMVSSLIYYGLSLGISDLAGCVHLNIVIAGVLEFPAIFIGALLIKRFGRVRLLICCYTLSGLSSFISAGAFGREHLEILVSVTSMIGRFFVAISFTIQFLYTAEVAPTSVRTLFVGSGSTWARVGSLIAPQIGLLNMIWQPLPFIIYGLLPVAAALFSFMLPETNHRLSPETIKEGEIFVNVESASNSLVTEPLDNGE